MSSGALFGNNVARGTSKNLVEFKAGKMTLKSNKVYPDNRKGQLYVYQSDDSLMHFCWKDRTSGVVEDDLIIFPDDCEFKAVPQCTTGRVYLLKFKSSSRRFFFWLQDLKTDKDEEHCRKINEVLNNPPTPGSQRSGGANPEGDLQNLLNNMSQQQLMQLFGGVGQIGGLGTLLGTMSRNARTTTTSSTPVATTVARPPAAQTPAPSTTTTTVTGTTTTETQKTTTAETKTPTKTTTPASGTEDEARTTIKVSDLAQYLSGIPTPSGERTDQSGQAGPVIHQFGLGTETVTAASNGNLEEFVKALEFETKGGQKGHKKSRKGKDEKSKKQPPSGAGPSDKKDDDDDDEGMFLD